MTTTVLTGKILMTIATVFYGFIPPFVDFNATHATNPSWVGHARFHIVWQVMSTFFLGILSLYLLWFCKDNPVFTNSLSFIIGCIVLGGFFLNVGIRKIYAGTLSDPNGVPPIFKNVDTNLFFFSLASLMLVSGYLMIR